MLRSLLKMLLIARRRNTIHLHLNYAILHLLEYLIFIKPTAVVIVTVPVVSVLLLVVLVVFEKCERTRRVSG